MVSNTHEDGQIVVSEEITLTSPPENTNDSNKYDLAESSSSKKSVLSKNEEQMKFSVQHDNDNVENKEVVAEKLSSIPGNDNDNELSHTEEEITICDICGDLGDEDLLVICSKCEVGAEHTYCMMLKINDHRNGWLCYDCTKDEDGMREREETSSMKRKDESFIDFFKMEERKLSQEQPHLLNTQNVCKSVGVDLNTDLNVDPNADPNIDMNEEPRSKKRKTDSFIDFFKISEEASSSQANLLNTKSRCKIVGLDLNIDPSLNLNTGPNIDLNVDPNIDLNVDPNINMNVEF